MVGEWKVRAVQILLLFKCQEGMIILHTLSGLNQPAEHLADSSTTEIFDSVLVCQNYRQDVCIRVRRLSITSQHHILQHGDEVSVLSQKAVFDMAQVVDLVSGSRATIGSQHQ